MHVTVETITPGKAVRFVATQNRNRKIKRGHVVAIAQAMRQGTFLTSGDPIRFNTTACWPVSRAVSPSRPSLLPT